ncbi:MAG: metallophosphoesterase family protein [Burkholderiaceae bacterium]
MRVLVHLSDLHFGRVDEGLLEPLRGSLARLRPALVVVSGDLTQRARRRQFRAARAFLDTLPAPVLAVPGNHDVPLYDVVRRFLRPLHRYRRYINEELEPLYVDHEMAVAGLNTTRSLTVQGGRINRRQLERVCSRLQEVDPRLVRIVVTHHPFDAPAGHDDRKLVGRAALAMESLAACGVDVCLAGHLHVGHVAHAANRYVLPDGRGALLVQAGTATSTRGRGEVNSFNALHLDGAVLQVERHAWDAAAGEFRVIACERFRRGGDGWSRAEACQ